MHFSWPISILKSIAEWMVINIVVLNKLALTKKLKIKGKSIFILVTLG